MTGPLLGVFCPFWSPEGPHFGLPHFQGMLGTLGANVTILDLNIQAAESLMAEWSALSANEAGLWSDSARTAELLKLAGLSRILIDVIATRQPLWVVFLSVNVASYHAARHLMREVRATYSKDDVRIAVGGPLCLHLENGAETFPDADLVWSGTLESALPHLIGEKVPNTEPGFSLPRFRPDFTGIDMARYSRPERLTYLLNYGCRFRCRFCHEGAQYRREVARPTTALGTELRELVASLPTVRYIRFFDSSLNSDHGQFLDLLEELSGAAVLWGCYLTPTPRIDGEVAQRMAIAGCMGVNIGVESGSVAVRRLMAKPSPRIEVVESCIRALHGAGLDVSINLIVGYPGETERDLEDTLRFLDRTAGVLSDVAVGKAGIYAGTPLFGQVQALGIELNGDARDEFVFNHWTLEDKNNTPEIRASRLRRVENHLGNSGFLNARSEGAEDPGRRALSSRGIATCAE